MEEPKYPYKSGNYISYKEYIEHTLLKKLYVHPDCREGVKERISDELLSENLDRPVDAETGLPLDMPQIEEWWHEENILSLDELMKLKPDDVDSKDIIVQINRDRQIDHIQIRVFYRTKNPQSIEEWQAEEAAEDAEWEERFAQYKEDLFEYRKWELEQKQKTLREDIEKEVC